MIPLRDERQSAPPAYPVADLRCFDYREGETQQEFLARFRKAYDELMRLFAEDPGSSAH